MTLELEKLGEAPLDGTCVVFWYRDTCLDGASGLEYAAYVPQEDGSCEAWERFDYNCSDD